MMIEVDGEAREVVLDYKYEKEIVVAHLHCDVPRQRHSHEQQNSGQPQSPDDTAPVPPARYKQEYDDGGQRWCNRPFSQCSEPEE